MKKFTKEQFRRELVSTLGGCNIQHNGWPCGSCFFGLKGVNNADWQSILYYRGDYTKAELDNLPKQYINNIQKIAGLIGI